MLKISRLFAGVAFGAASLFTVLANAQTNLIYMEIDGPTSIQFEPRGYVFYDLTFHNDSSNSIAPIILIPDPKNLEFNQSVSDEECKASSYDGWYVECSSNQLVPAGGSETYKIGFRMPSVCVDGTLSSHSTAQAELKTKLSYAEGNGTEKITTTFTGCPSTDLRITVEQDNTSMAVHNTQTFRVTVFNSGANNESNAMVYSEVFFDGFDEWEYVSNSGNVSCSLDSDYLDGEMVVYDDNPPRLMEVFLCTGISVGSQQSSSFNLVLRPAEKACPEELELKLSVKSNTQLDSSLSNNSKTVTTNVTCDADTSSSPSSSSSSSTSSVTTTQSSSSSFARVVDESDDAENLPFKGNFLNMTLNNQEVLFKDVPVLDWFAPYVYHLIKAGIASGYNDANGNPLGQYGPGNNVTYGEIAKMALNAARIPTVAITDAARASNPTAQGHWSESYVATMEYFAVSMYNTVDVNAYAPRGAVLEILYQVGSIPTVTPTGTVYSDVSAGHQYAGSIETATAAGIVSGDAGSDTFRPNAPINRAETAKILDLYMQTY